MAGAVPMAADSLEIPTLVGNLDVVRTGSFSEETRLQALESARNLVSALAKPEEVILHYAFELGSHRMALRVGCDLHIFRILSERHGDPISAHELATETKAQLLLIVRLMRVLTAMGFAAEAGEQRYVATKFTDGMAKPALEGATIICHDHSALVLHRAHEYLREHDYTLPTAGEDCMFQWALDTRMSYFEYINSDPAKSQAFNTFMSANQSTRKNWTEWYPIESELLRGFSPQNHDDVLLVDVGGGKGHYLLKFAAKFPASKGHLALQDLPSVIAASQHLESEGIRPLAHDFFTPQPIHGARAYYTHFVLHDWSDTHCIRILENLKSALRRGYSQVLLNEAILPDTACPSFFAGMDWNMHAIAAGMERTARQWTELVEAAGLRVVRIQKSPFPGDWEGVVVAELPEGSGEM